MFIHALKFFDQSLMNEVLKKIRAVFVKTDVMNKNFIVIKITIIEIKTLKISTVITEYANIRF